MGLTQSFDGNVVMFQRDLGENIAHGDENYLSLLDAADAYVQRNGLDLPEEPEARFIPADPECVTHPLLEHERGRHVDHLGDRLCNGFQLVASQCLRREGQAEASAWCIERAGHLFSGFAMAVAARFGVHLGRVA